MAILLKGEYMRFLKLADITAYRKSFDLSNTAWKIIIKWDYFAKDTVGKQFCRAIDSVSANVAEGFGRYHRKDKEKFYYNARGSVYESLDWLQKSKVRDLITETEYKQMFQVLSELPKDVNTLIRYTEQRLTK